MEYLFYAYIIGAVIVFCLVLIGKIKDEGKLTLADLIEAITFGSLSWMVFMFLIIDELDNLMNKLDKFVIWQRKKLDQ